MFEMTWESAHSIVLRQDLPYGVTTAHAGITNKAMPKFMFGENELALQYMHGQIKRALGEAVSGGLDKAPLAIPDLASRGARSNPYSFAPTICRAARYPK